MTIYTVQKWAFVYISNITIQIRSLALAANKVLLLEKKNKKQQNTKKTLNQRPFLITGAKPTVFTLEKGGVEFVPTQHHTQRSLWSSETRLSQFTACAECKASLLRECHSCFPELRLQYLEESRPALSSTARPRKHDIILEQKRESWQIYWDGCDYGTHLAGQPLWKRQWLAALQCRAVRTVRVYSSSLQLTFVSPLLVA